MQTISNTIQISNVFPSLTPMLSLSTRKLAIMLRHICPLTSVPMHACVHMHTNMQKCSQLLYKQASFFFFARLTK